MLSRLFHPMMKRGRTVAVSSAVQSSFLDHHDDSWLDKNDTASVVLDDPCWGSPESCSLSDLLKLTRREDCILHESQDYLVLNKPADLRMDGPYPATVHKLLTYWYPPPSLRAQVVVHAARDEVRDASTAGEDPHLLQAVSSVHKHSDIPDNELRPCHQLDYATSGVLLLARHAAAANRARQLFEGRDSALSKRYVAVVQGHLAADPSWPRRSVDDLDSHLSALERDYRRCQQKKRHKPHTFQGYQPAHSVYQIWRQQVAKGKRRHDRFTDELWNEIWKPLESTNLKELLVEQPNAKWADLKGTPSYTSAFEQAAATYNGFLRQRHQGHAQSASASDRVSALPLVFRDERDRIYVCVPLAEHPHDFAMRVPSRQHAFFANIGSHQLDHLPSNAGSVPTGDDSLDYKPALTKCTVLSHCYLSIGSGPPIPVTKVSLEPRTGRRHQLRVHLALLGHSVVGDRTYGRNNGDEREDGCPRMCLHSAQLQLPGLHVTAPDPFVLDEHQRITVGPI